MNKEVKIWRPKFIDIGKESHSWQNFTNGPEELIRLVLRWGIKIRK